jgi:hypothetical protein
MKRGNSYSHDRLTFCAFANSLGVSMSLSARRSAEFDDLQVCGAMAAISRLNRPPNLRQQPHKPEIPQAPIYIASITRKLE